MAVSDGQCNELSSSMRVSVLKCSSKRTPLHKPDTACCHFRTRFLSWYQTQTKALVAVTNVSNEVCFGCCRVRHSQHVQLAHLRWSGRNFDTATQAWRTTSRFSRWSCVWDFSSLSYPRSLRSSIITLLQVSTSWQQSGALCWGIHALRSRTKSRTTR